MDSTKTLLRELKGFKNPEKALAVASYLQAFKGGYGEGDHFWGISVPETRSVAKKYYSEIPLDQISVLLKDPIHEVRLCALIMMVHRYGDKKLPDLRKELYELYLLHTQFINNWDLIDGSVDKIVGAWLFDKKRSLLYEWAKKGNLREQRMGIIATFYFIKQNDFEDTIALCSLFLNHPHDLIQKACGWMLREVGKRKVEVLISFLSEHHDQMPRTMLRYSIEKFNEHDRKAIMKGTYF